MEIKLNKLEFFNEFLEEHRDIEWQTIQEEETGKWLLLLRRPDLPKYAEEPAFASQLTQEEFKIMPKDKLYAWIGGQFDVEGITRITGYMGKIRNFNPGKKGELKERVRVGDQIDDKSAIDCGAGI